MPGTLVSATSRGSASSIVLSAGSNVNLTSVRLPVATPGAAGAVEALFVAVGCTVAGGLVEAATVGAAVGAPVGTSVGPLTINAGTMVWYGDGTPVGGGGEVGCGGKASRVCPAAGAATVAMLPCGAGAAGAGAQLNKAKPKARAAALTSTRWITMSS